MSDPKPQESTALALPDQGKHSAEIIRGSTRQAVASVFVPKNLSEAMALAKMMAGSEMVPKQYQKKPANIIIAMQFGSEIGLPPMQSLQSISVINGNPSLWGDAALALCQNHPDFEDIVETTNGTVATCTVKRKGRTPVTRTFSDEDAAKAQLLTKGPWQQYRNRMRQLRARGFALRDCFPDVLKGIKLAEEAMDIPPQQDNGTERGTAPATIDSGTLQDVLTQSSEPNRGHDDTGLGKQQREQKSEDQTQKKLDPFMCSECRSMVQSDGSGHAADCKFAVATEKEQPTKQLIRSVYLLKKVVAKTSKTKGQYNMLSVITNTDPAKEGTLYVWRGHLREQFEQLVIPKQGLPVMLVVSEQTAPDGNATFIAVEHILEIAGIEYVDDKPVQQTAALESTATAENAAPSKEDIFGGDA